MGAALRPLALVAVSLPASALAYPTSLAIQADDDPQPLVPHGNSPHGNPPSGCRPALPLGAAARGLFGGVVSGC